MPKRNCELNDELRQLLRQLIKSGKLPSNYARIIADQLNEIPRSKLVTPNQVSNAGTGRGGTLEIAEAIVELAEQGKTRQLIERIRRLLAEAEAEGE